MSRRRLRLIVVVLSLTLLSTTASGQARTIAELSTYVKQGDIVELTVGSLRTRGAFERATADGVTLRRPGRQDAFFPADRVQRVRRVDRPTNGMLIGLGAGMTAGFIVALRMSPDSGRCSALGPYAGQFEGCGDDRNSAFSTLTTLGFVAGATIDGVMKTTVYQASTGPATVRLTPVLGRRQRGLAVGVRF
jgi:hypothetical protein